MERNDIIRRLFQVQAIPDDIFIFRIQTDFGDIIGGTDDKTGFILIDCNRCIIINGEGKTVEKGTLIAVRNHLNTVQYQRVCFHISNRIERFCFVVEFGGFHKGQLIGGFSRGYLVFFHQVDMDPPGAGAKVINVPIDLGWNISGGSRPGGGTAAVDIHKGYLAQRIHADDGRTFRRLKALHTVFRVCVKAVIIGYNGIIVGLSVFNVFISEHMANPGIIPQIEFNAVDIHRMGTGFAILQIKLGDGFPVCFITIRIGDNFAFKKLGFRSAVNHIALKIVFLQEGIKRLFGKIIPHQSDFPVTGIDFYRGFQRRFGKLIIRVVDLLDGFFVFYQIVFVFAE
ncbi:MAG: hypothetical protein XE04_1612 [Marinimicrobia bacterium 46_43]|nr:MAG: hypothetical protein XE04_1612 [Marinimicrobia bacterium 46_43]